MGVYKTVLALRLAEHILLGQSLPSLPAPRSLMTLSFPKRAWWLWWMTGWTCTSIITRTTCLGGSRKKTRHCKNSSKSWALWAVSFWPNIGPFWRPESPQTENCPPHSRKVEGIASKNPEVLALDCVSRLFSRGVAGPWHLNKDQYEFADSWLFFPLLLDVGAFGHFFLIMHF